MKGVAVCFDNGKRINVARTEKVSDKLSGEGNEEKLNRKGGKAFLNFSFECKFLNNFSDLPMVRYIMANYIYAVSFIHNCSNTVQSFVLRERVNW